MGAASAATGSEATAEGIRPQQTLSRAVVVAGVGYWGGQENRVELRPAPAGSGVVFVREDLGGQRIPAALGFRVDAASRTNLQAGSATVEMVEHVLSALAALQVDCCEVGLTSAELPGLDGSAQAYVEAIDAVGIVQHEATVRPLCVVEPIVLEAAAIGACIEARPPTTAGLFISYELEYPGKPIPPQHYAAAVTPEHYRMGIAAARTFLPEEDARQLQEQGFGLAVTTADLLVFGPAGPIDNPLRWPDECARHKVLDVVGDLSLAGRPVHADIIARRSGHRLNAALLEAMLAGEHQRQESADEA
jgi:UDP-3-O-acyl N-acetylglucosamine deacetylase